MTSRGALVIRYIGDTRDLERSSKRATSTLQKMRGPALGVAAGITAVGASAVNLEKQFSQSMNLVAATTKAPAKEMKGLQDLAIKLGKDTSFSANEAGTAMLELAKGGLSAADIKAGALKGTLQLAAAGGTDLATAAGIAANALNTFGLKGKDMAKVSAALAGGANASTASVESLGQALSQVGPGARNAGLDINETVGALAAFDSAGIKGSDAGTSLKTMLTRLVPNTKKARDAMKDLGLKFTDANGKFKPLTNVAQQLKDKMGGLSQEQRTLAMNTIFGSDATRAATVLMNEGGKGLKKYIKATKDRGAAQRAADARMKGTAGALERLSGSWETLRLTIGMKVAPAVVFIANRLGGMTNFLTDNSKAVLIGVGVVAAFTVAILAANVAISVASTVMKVWTATTAAANAVSKLCIGTRLGLLALWIRETVVIAANRVAYAAWTVAAGIANAVGKLEIGTRLAMVGLWIRETAAMLANRAGVIAQVAVRKGASWALFLGMQSRAILGWARETGAMVVNKAAMLAAATAHKVVRGAMMVAAGAQWALNAAMSANPIGLVIAGIVLLVGGLTWFFTKTKVGQKIVRVAWSGIKSAIKGVSDWWTKTAWPAIKSAIKAMGSWFKMVGSSVARIWRAMGDGIGKVWRWIKRNVIDRFVFGLKVLRLAFLIARDRVSSAFGSMRDRLASVGSWIRKHVFGKIRSALTLVKDAFNTAKTKIGEFWSKIKNAAKAPVKFVIETVWNNGLRKVLNGIPGVNIDPVSLPKGFRSGGAIRGPGTGTSDSIAARLSKGEHVWTAREVAKAGGQKAMYAMRQAVLKGNLNGDPKFANGGSLSPADIARAQKFAHRQAGKPYGWGAVGPSAYDCSGFMSALTNVLHGSTPYDRVGSTANFPWAGFKKGSGQFTVVSTPNYAASGVGHMAGTLGGMNVESRGGRGVLVGPGAMGANSRGFSQMYHLGAAGPADGSAGWLQQIGDVIAAMKRLPGQVQEMLSGGSWIGPFLKKMTSGLWSNLAGYLNKKIPDFGPIPNNPIPSRIPTFDNGGTLSPGYNTVYNGLGRPEALRRADEGPVQRISLDGELGDAIVKVIRRKVKSGGGSVQLVLGRAN